MNGARRHNQSIMVDDNLSGGASDEKVVKLDGNHHGHSEASATIGA